MPMKRWNGMNWIRQEKRLAIYLRDGLACCYCGAAAEEEAQLTLDHFIPRSKGGGNEARNLITACKRCNSSRGARSVKSFCRAVGEYLCVPHERIYDRINRSRNRTINTQEAKQIMKRR